MLSLYRRHRPRTFADVVGQEHIVRTLRNAIGLGKVHHAYLFVGSRGTGKTSTAKLLACALNAEGGPSADFPADAPSCKAIMAGTSLDVVEMDAASNNSVDDIRELRENVALAPMGGGSRVYILDEAHMLSTAAWNAFLKTLEEPPAHVVFVLATTEAHKVPATIVDRCHRFDFHRPSLEQIAGVLRKVAAEEEIGLPDAAVGLLARHAAGSFRDALGTLEQLVTYGGKEVQLDDVLQVLGVADAELVLESADALGAHDPKAALLAVERLAASGRDYVQFMKDFAAHLRHLFVVQTLGDVPDSFAVTAEHTDRLAGQAERLAQGEVVRAIDLLADALGKVKDGAEPRIQLEIALLKAAQPQADLTMQALMFRIEQLEQRLAQGGGAPVAPPTAPPPAPKPEAEHERERAASPAAEPASRPQSRPEAPAPRAERPAAEPVAAVAQAAPEESPAPVLDFDRLVTLWPAVVDAVMEQNGLIGASLAEGRPATLEGSRLIVAFPTGSEFAKKKVESKRELLHGAIKGLTGQAVDPLCELGGEPAPDARPAALSEAELLERLRSDFGATEILDDDPDQPEA
ncbi:MAG: DNA polymerase III subunit gamma/tau [Thermoleophilaceae bacterium]